MPDREELDASYESDQFRRFAPAPFTRYSHYLTPAIIAGILLLFGVQSHILYGILILLGSITVLSYGFRLHLWNRGVRKYGREPWLEFMDKTYNKNTD